MAAEDNERGKIRTYNIGMLLLAGVSIVALNLYIYQNFAFGFGHLFGNYVGAVLISWVPAWAFTRKPETNKFRAPIALSLALAVLLGSNFKQVQLIYDVKEAKKVLAGVAGPADLKRKLDEGSDNRVLAAGKFIFKASEDTRKEITALIVGINPPELDAPMDYEKASLSDLKSYRMALKTAEGNALMAEAQINFIFAREKARVKDYLKDNQFEYDFKRGVLEGIEPRHKDYISYFKRFLKLKAEELGLTYQLLSLLIKEHGQYKRNMSGTFIFANDSATAGFNELLANLNSNQEHLQKLLAEGEVIDQRYLKKFQKFLSRSN